jgi:hypothetical protein
MRPEALEKRFLFIGGCQRSGTTALARYLNEHAALLITEERYKGKLEHADVTPDLFTFEKILDVRPEHTNKGPKNLAYLKRYHSELLARKDETKLRWVGDKNPGYVNSMEVLAENNPGAHFIMIYRPIEEVVESWQARSRNPSNQWLYGKDGFRLGVETWNKAQRNTRKYLQSDLKQRILLLHYHDFFYRNEVCVPLISRFLNLEFDSEIRESWARTSAEFESRRRPKEELTAEQREFIQQHKDHEAEKFVLGRIREQWEELELPIGEIVERRLEEQRESEGRERVLQDERRRLRREKRRIKLELEGIKNSRSWKLVNRINSLKARVSRR